MTDEHELPDTVIEAIDALESAATDYGRANYDETLRTSRAKIARALADKCSARRELDAVLLAHIPTPPPALQEETPHDVDCSFQHNPSLPCNCGAEPFGTPEQGPATDRAMPAGIALRIRMAHGDANADRQTVPDNDDVIQWLYADRDRLVEVLAEATEKRDLYCRMWQEDMSKAESLEQQLEFLREREKREAARADTAEQHLQAGRALNAHIVGQLGRQIAQHRTDELAMAEELHALRRRDTEREDHLAQSRTEIEDGRQVRDHLRQEVQELRVAADVLDAALACHDDACTLDHHGRCQAHYVELDCWVRRGRSARRVMTTENGRPVRRMAHD